MTETPYPEYWPDAYRFAFLMTGSAATAQAAIQAVVPCAAERLIQMRDGRQAKRWLFARLREQCRAPSTPSAPAPADEAAERFALLPEEERCALALFYLHRFEPAELAETLDLSLLELGRVLGSARMMLGRQRETPVAPAIG